MKRPPFDEAAYIKAATENAVRVWSNAQLHAYINRMDADELILSCAIAEDRARGEFSHAKTKDSEECGEPAARLEGGP